jgi:Flp pilus assembly protein TadD
MLLLVMNRPDEARKQFHEVLAIDSAAPVAANNLAYMHAEAGTDLNVALTLAQKAKANLPDDPNVNDTLGWVLYKQALGARAITHFHEAIAKDPTNATYQYHLGMAYLQLKDRAKARSALEKALALNLKPREAAEALNPRDAAEARKALAGIQG